MNIRHSNPLVTSPPPWANAGVAMAAHMSSATAMAGPGGARIAGTNVTARYFARSPSASLAAKA